MTDPKVSIATVVDLVLQQKDQTERSAAIIRDAQKQRELAIDTRADYAEGAAAAYSMCLSIIAGAFGVDDARRLSDQWAVAIHVNDDGSTSDAMVRRDQLMTLDAMREQWPVDHENGE